jgi:hypothetical protein
MMARYGRRPPPPPPQPATPTYRAVVVGPKTKGGLPTVLNEKQLKVTLTVVVVKLVCPK